MKTQRLLHFVALALFLPLLITGVMGMTTSTVLAQDPPPRPSPPPEPPKPPPPRPTPPPFHPTLPPLPSSPEYGGGIMKDEIIYPCTTVHGFVVNRGYRNEPKVPIVLSGPSWQTYKVTDDNGYYASDCLGVGVALLNPVSPFWLHPLTTDVAIRLGYKQSFEVNLGLYGSGWFLPPEVVPTMSVSPTHVLPGETLTYTIRVTNTQRVAYPGRKMNGVMITDLLPESLKLIEITSTRGTTELWGNLLTVDIGELATGQTVTVIAVTKVREDILLPSPVITNQASLIYGDHVVVQTCPVIVKVPHSLIPPKPF